MNVQPAGRWSALHHAAHAGNADAVRDLLRFGADPRAETKDGETPRALATAPVVQRLLELAEAGRAPADRGATCGATAAERWRFL